MALGLVSGTTLMARFFSGLGEKGTESLPVSEIIFGHICKTLSVSVSCYTWSLGVVHLQTNAVLSRNVSGLAAAVVEVCGWCWLWLSFKECNQWLWLAFLMFWFPVNATVKYPTNYSATQGTQLSLYSDSHDHLNCNDCILINSCNHFSSSVNGSLYRKNFQTSECDCETVNLVYLITCKHCKMQYAGETKHSQQPARRSILDIFAVKKTPQLPPISINHLTYFSEATLEIIEIIRGPPNTDHVLKTRIQRETYWIITFKSLSSIGINGRLGRPILVLIDKYNMGKIQTIQFSYSS